MHGFSLQLRHPGPDFPSHLDFPSPLQPPPPRPSPQVSDWQSVLPVCCCQYDWERERSVRNQRGGLSAETRRGDMGVRGGEENSLAFLSRFLECPQLFTICNSSQLCQMCKNQATLSSFQLRKKPAKQQIKRTMREWSFCYSRQQGPSLFTEDLSSPLR